MKLPARAIRKRDLKPLLELIEFQREALEIDHVFEDLSSALKQFQKLGWSDQPKKRGK